MLFWVFLVIAIILTFFIGGFADEMADSVVGKVLIWLFFTGMAWFLLLLAWVGLGYMSANTVRSETKSQYTLRALDSGTGIEGRSYFLGGGYINSERVLNYIIANPDGSSQLGHSKADYSKIWEDSPAKPYVVQIERRYGNDFIGFNDTFKTTYEYEYHIPAGSVLESTKITNK